MKKSYLALILLLIVMALGVGGFFVYNNYFSKEAKEETTVSQTKPLQLDSKNEATHLSKAAGTKGVYWMRGLPIVWNSVEKKQGEYDWTMIDGGITGSKDDYFSGAVYHLPIIWPYANWDQKSCHQGEKYEATGHLKEAGEDLMMGAPCDLKAYAAFLAKVVERYDGDGEDDMPGLKIPIKYWEIMNEPSMQGGSVGGAGEDLKFFVGTSQEYLEILKTSYETIKKVDSQAKVAHAGMAGMQESFRGFWDPVFAGGGGKYFDIANIHTIGTDERKEDMYLVRFNRYLKKYGLLDKPIWITEVQFGDLMGKPKDLEKFEETIVRASVFALAKGADKLFYIENWLSWNDQPEPGGKKDKGMKEVTEPEKDKSPGKKEDKFSKELESSTHKVYLNLVAKINSFEKIEVLNEKYYENPSDYEGATSNIGHYKFINGKKAIYVLWGKASVPSQIKGKVIVTDIWGEEKEIDASKITLTDTPIFVELKK